MSNEREHKEANKIKHIVISGGSAWGFCAFGILYEALESGFLNMGNIETLYTTSVGSIIGAMIILKIEPNILKDYLIKRPWDTVCKKNRCSLFEIYDNKGIIYPSFFKNMFSPLLKSVDLSLDSSLLDIYNYNSIEFHIYTTELNSFQLVDISYKTHPDWKLVDAIHASCSIPILFSPLIDNSMCYIDGAVFMNYPLCKCIENGANPDEILGIKLGGKKEDQREPNELITEKSNLFDVVNRLVSNFIRNTDTHFHNHSYKILHEIIVYSGIATLEIVLNVLYSKEERTSLIYNGIQTMKNYITSKHYSQT